MRKRSRKTREEYEAPSLLPEARTVRRSPLARFADHVHAIGMVTVEMGNLELMFVHLLGTMLHIPEATAAAILVTPRATRSRLEVITNVAAEVLSKEQSRSVDRLAKKAIAILGKRNEIVHDFWGVSKDRTEVMRSPHPYGEPKPVKLTDLNQDIDRLRRLADEVLDFSQRLADEMQLSPHCKVDVTHKIGPETSD